MKRTKDKSRQHLWIERMRAMGRCVTCGCRAEKKRNGLPGIKGRYFYCKKHRVLRNIWQLVYVRDRKAKARKS